MDNALHHAYLGLIAYGLQLPNCECEGYYVVDGQAHERGKSHDILRWHLDHASPRELVSNWALVSVAQVVAQITEPV